MNHYLKEVKAKADVIFLSEVNWSYLRQRHHFFAESYAKKNHNVIYVGKIGLRYPKIKDILKIFRKKQINSLINSSHKGVYFFKGLLLPPINFFFNVLNDLWFANKLVRSTKSNQIIVHFYQPTKLVYDLVIKLKDSGKQVTLIYDCVQDYRFHPSRSKSLLNFEKILTNQSDIVIADSIVNLKRLDFNKKILVPPGVDVNHFRIKTQNKLNSNQTKKILYYGNIRQDLDFNMINKIGVSKKFEIILLGLLNVSNSKFNKRVKILDAIDYKELPKIIKNYDALILPYDVSNSFTEAIIPAKFFECLATGLPIISTKMISTKKFHHLLNIINNDTNFDDFKLKNITFKEKIEREKIINSSSWSNRFKSFYEKIKY